MSTAIGKLYLNAGQMKAGTTYLYDILKGHNGIHFAGMKETHYLSHRYGQFNILGDAIRKQKARELIEQFHSGNPTILQYQRGMQYVADYLRSPAVPGWYLDLFKGRKSGQWLADFSNLTCTIPVAGLREISQFADDVRVTYCVRDAVPRAISHAKFHLGYAGKSHDLTVLSADDLRKLLKTNNIYPQSQVKEHISALHEVFGDDRLRIIRCEDLWSDPQAIANAVCDFLDIAPIEGEVTRLSSNTGPRSPMNEETSAIFEEIFGPLQSRQDQILENHRNILIETPKMSVTI